MTWSSTSPKTAAYRAPGTPARLLRRRVVRSTSLRRSSTWTRWTCASRTPSKEGDNRPMRRQVGPPSATSRRMEAMKNHPHYKSELAGRQPRPRRRDGLLGQRAASRPAPAPQRQRRRHRQPRHRLASTSAARAPRSRMQLAETLGIDAEDVSPKVVDTDSVGFTGAHRRQPHHLRRRLGRLRAGPGHPQADGRPRRPDLGGRRRPRSSTATTASSAAPRTPRARTAR